MALSENEHHVIPRSRGGADVPGNVEVVSVRWHNALHRFFGNDLTHEKILRVLSLDAPLVSPDTESEILDVLEDVLDRERMYVASAIKRQLRGESFRPRKGHRSEYTLFGAERTHEKIYRILEWDEKVLHHDMIGRLSDRMDGILQNGTFYVENPGKVVVPLHLRVPLSMYPHPQPNLVLAPQPAV